MKFIINTFLLYISLCQPCNHELYGEWISVDKSWPVSFIFAEGNSLIINSILEKEYSLYPQNFHFECKSNVIFLMNENEIINSFKIVKLSHSELVLKQEENGAKLVFIKYQSDLDYGKVLSFLNHETLVFKYEDSKKTDILFQSENMQILTNDSFSCIANNNQILKIKNAEFNPLLKTWIGNKRCYITKITDKTLEGLIFSQNNLSKIIIEKLDLASTYNDLSKTKKNLIGNWIFLKNLEQFEAVREKKYKPIYFHHHKINFLDSNQFELPKRKTISKSNYKIKKIGNSQILFTKYQESEEWEIYGRIEFIDEKFLIISSLESCFLNPLGYNNRVSFRVYLTKI